MYSLNPIEELRYREFCNLIDNRNLFIYIEGEMVFVTFNSIVIFAKMVNELTISDVNDILGVSLCDSSYKCFFIKSAYENEVLGKRKSLRL